MNRALWVLLIVLFVIAAIVYLASQTLIPANASTESWAALTTA